MKIISRFKDCYDHISHVFGVDEKIVYVRDIIPHTEVVSSDIPGYRKLCELNHSLVQCEVNKTIEFTIIVIVDKMYFVVGGSGVERVVDPNGQTMNSRYFFRDKSHTDTEMILSFTKKVGVPVYRIKRIRRDGDKLVATIDSKTPRISDIRGLVGMLDAQQTYQSIAYAIANQLKPSPDTSPPIEIDDKYKIVAAGFDLKQSFRHRK